MVCEGDDKIVHYAKNREFLNPGTGLSAVRTSRQPEHCNNRFGDNRIFKWSQVNPQEDVYDWSVIEEYLSRAYGPFMKTICFWNWH